MEWDVEKYEKFSGMQTSIGLKNIAKLSPRAGEDVLDIGCGRGNLTAAIAKKVGAGSVVGIDPDASMIEAAKRHLKESGVSNVSLINLGVLDIDWEERFDAAYSNIVLHWIRDLQDALDRIFATLKDYGRISFAMLYQNTQPEEESDLVKIQQFEVDQFQFFVERGHHLEFLTQNEYDEYQQRVDPNLSYAVFPVQKIEELLKNAGFGRIRIETEFVPNTFDDADGYFRYRQSNMWQYFFSYFPPAVREPIRDRLIELILDDWNKVPVENREMPIREEWPVAYVTAQRR